MVTAAEGVLHTSAGLATVRVRGEAQAPVERLRAGLKHPHRRCPVE